MKNNSKRIATLVLAISSSFMLLFYAPLELYLTNKKEFWFDIYILLPVLLVSFLGGALVVLAILLLQQKIIPRFTKEILVIGFSVYLASYIQGNYFSYNLPPLDGTIPEWDQYIADGWISAVLWCASFFIFTCAALRMKDKFYTIVIWLGTGITAMLVLTGITLCFTNDGLERKKAISVTTKGAMEFSGEENFVVLLFDALDSKLFEEVLDSDEQYGAVFTDFTFYPDTTSCYPYTQESVPQILSGIWYENERPYEEYRNEAYEMSPLLRTLEEKGYSLALYDDDYPQNSAAMYRFENVVKDVGEISNYPKFGKLLMKYTAFKYAPYQLKSICFDMITTTFVDFQKAPDGYETVCNFWQSNWHFISGLREEDITLSDEKKFKFYHLQGPHVPHRFNENVEWVGHGSYDTSVKASITMCKEFFEELQETGVYDNTVIIVMSDHGYNRDNGAYGRHNPALMIKGINERHPLTVSDLPISYDDLNQAYDNLLQGVTGEDVFGQSISANRRRRYLLYEFGKEEVMEECFILGNAREPESFIQTGQLYERK